MAEKEDPEVHNFKHYKGRFTWYLFFATLVASSGGLIFGYDIGIQGGVTSMDEFLIKFFPKVYASKHNAHESESNYCKYDNESLEIFSSSIYFIGLVAGCGASFVNNKYGRIKTLLGGGIAFLIGGILSGFAQNLTMLVIGRILLGVGIGFCVMTAPIYLSEISPANLRGALNITFQLAITVGILFSNVVNYGTSKMNHNGWRYSLGIAIVPAFIVILGGIFCPETPTSLIQRDLKDEGRKVLQKVRGIVDVDAEYIDIVEAVELAKQVKNPIRTLFSMKYRPQLIVANFIPLLQQMTGINVVIFYAPVLFNSIGFGGDDSLLSSTIVGAMNIVGAIISIIFVDKFGEESSSSKVMIGGLLARPLGDAKVSHVLIPLVICLFVLAFAWSWGPLGWLVPSEILPLEVRSAGQAIVVCVNLLCTAIVAQVVLKLLCKLQYGSFIFFAIWDVMATLFVYFLVPETKNIPIEEMHVIWQEHWFWKRIIPQDQVITNDFEKQVAVIVDE